MFDIQEKIKEFITRNKKKYNTFMNNKNRLNLEIGQNIIEQYKRNVFRIYTEYTKSEKKEGETQFFIEFIEKEFNTIIEMYKIYIDNYSKLKINIKNNEFDDISENIEVYVNNKIKIINKKLSNENNNEDLTFEIKELKNKLFEYKKELEIFTISNSQDYQNYESLQKMLSFMEVYKKIQIANFKISHLEEKNKSINKAIKTPKITKTKSNITEMEIEINTNYGHFYKKLDNFIKKSSNILKDYQKSLFSEREINEIKDAIYKILFIEKTKEQSQEDIDTRTKKLIDLAKISLKNIKSIKNIEKDIDVYRDSFSKVIETFITDIEENVLELVSMKDYIIEEKDKTIEENLEDIIELKNLFIETKDSISFPEFKKLIEKEIDEKKSLLSKHYFKNKIQTDFDKYSSMLKENIDNILNELNYISNIFETIIDFKTKIKSQYSDKEKILEITNEAIGFFKENTLFTKNYDISKIEVMNNKNFIELNEEIEFELEYNKIKINKTENLTLNLQEFTEKSQNLLNQIEDFKNKIFKLNELSEEEIKEIIQDIHQLQQDLNEHYTYFIESDFKTIFSKEGFEKYKTDFENASLKTELLFKKLKSSHTILVEETLKKLSQNFEISDNINPENNHNFLESKSYSLMEKNIYNFLKNPSDTQIEIFEILLNKQVFTIQYFIENFQNNKEVFQKYIQNIEIYKKDIETIMFYLSGYNTKFIRNELSEELQKRDENSIGFIKKDDDFKFPYHILNIEFDNVIIDSIQDENGINFSNILLKETIIEINDENKSINLKLFLETKEGIKEIYLKNIDLTDFESSIKTKMSISKENNLNNSFINVILNSIVYIQMEFIDQRDKKIEIQRAKEEEIKVKEKQIEVWKKEGKTPEEIQKLLKEKICNPNNIKSIKKQINNNKYYDLSAKEKELKLIEGLTFVKPFWSRKNGIYTLNKASIRNYNYNPDGTKKDLNLHYEKMFVDTDYRERNFGDLISNKSREIYSKYLKDKSGQDLNLSKALQAENIVFELVSYFSPSLNTKSISGNFWEENKKDFDIEEVKYELEKMDLANEFIRKRLNQLSWKFNSEDIKIIKQDAMNLINISFNNFGIEFNISDINSSKKNAKGYDYLIKDNKNSTINISYKFKEGKSSLNTSLEEFSNIDFKGKVSSKLKEKTSDYLTEVNLFIKSKTNIIDIILKRYEIFLSNHPTNKDDINESKGYTFKIKGFESEYPLVNKVYDSIDKLISNFNKENFSDKISNEDKIEKFKIFLNNYDLFGKSSIVSDNLLETKYIIESLLIQSDLNELWKSEKQVDYSIQEGFHTIIKDNIVLDIMSSFEKINQSDKLKLEIIKRIVHLKEEKSYIISNGKITDLPVMKNIAKNIQNINIEINEKSFKAKGSEVSFDFKITMDTLNGKIDLFDFKDNQIKSKNGTMRGTLSIDLSAKKDYVIPNINKVLEKGIGISKETSPLMKPEFHSKNFS